MTAQETETLAVQCILGTDDLSLAQGLGHGLLETLTQASHDIAEALFQANKNAGELRELLSDVAAYVQHNIGILEESLTNSGFKSMCESVRASVAADPVRVEK